MAKVNVYDVLMDVASSINSHQGLEVAIPGKAEVIGDVKGWVPTSSLMLNMIFGRKDSKGIHLGVPIGRIIEIFGDFSHGKSTILQHIMNAFQKASGLSNIIDSEGAWDRHRSEKIGHIPDRNLHVEVDTVERGFEVLYELNSKYFETFSGRVPIVYGWDTLAAAPTEGEKSGDEYESGMGWKARLIRRELRRLTTELPKNNATLVVLNQVIDQFKKPGKTTPGGSGLKFWASQRLEVFKVSNLQDPATKKPIGIVSKVTMRKNKLAPPSRSLDIPIAFDHGIDPIWEVVNYHTDNTDLVNINGARIKIPEFDVSVYRREIPNLLTSNPEMLTFLQERAVESFFGVEDFSF
ncbi:MAG: DNA recombination/repair protein RecA [Gammaproteobacteria bacterium]|nr:DNA recombination/repair protein RecA [Gammaproteobacteria bacterium]